MDGGVNFLAQRDRPSIVQQSFARLLTLAVACFVGLLVVMLVRRCFSFAAFPDELSFVNVIYGWNRHHEGLLPPNHFGYGSTWWILLSRIVGEFKPDIYVHTNSGGGTSALLTPASSSTYAALIAARGLSIGFLLAAVAYAVATAKDLSTRLLNCGILLLPIVWWNGKWAGPGFLGIACAIVAASCLARKSVPWALFFLSAAVGFQLSNLVTLSGFFLLALGSQRFTRLALAGSLAAITTGYLVANPFVLTDYSAALENAQGVKATAHMTWEHIYNETSRCVFGNIIEWDLQSTGSIAHWWGSLLVPAVLAVGLAMSRQHVALVAIALSFVAGVAAVGFRGLGYGWYFMPTIAATYVLAVNLIPWPTWSPGRRNAIIGVLCFGLVISANASYREIRLNRARDKVLLRHYENAPFVEHVLQERLPGDTLLLLVDPISTMFNLPDDNFVILHDAMPILYEPAKLDNERMFAITTTEMERQSEAIRHFLRNLRDKGVPIEQRGDLIIARPADKPPLFDKPSAP